MGKAPGVYVSEGTLQRVIPTASPMESYGAFIGTALRGPTTPTRVDNWSDFVATFGGVANDKTLPKALYQFFSNTRAAAYVCRILPSDAKLATAKFTHTAKDRLTVDASSKGAWANSLKFSVTDINTTLNTFTFNVLDTIGGSDVIVESFSRCSMDKASGRYVINIVNSGTIGSNLVVLTDLSVPADPPFSTGTVSPIALQTGANGDGTQNITSTEYTAAFTKFDSIDAILVVNLAGMSDPSGATSVISAIATRGDSVLIMDPPENQPPDTGWATLPTSSYAALYYPWIYVPDPSPDAPRGSVIKTPPGGAVAGAILNSESSRGMYRAPAGASVKLVGTVATERKLTNAQLDDLATRKINVLRSLTGQGVTVMGARTFSTDAAQFLSIRRTLNWIKKRAAFISSFALFEPNGPALWSQLRVVNGAFLGELWQSGGLAGQSPDQAYFVKCDASINTPNTVMNGELHVHIGVAPIYPSEFIYIRVGYFESDASVVVTEEAMF